jgi:hypothetical protein
MPQLPRTPKVISLFISLVSCISGVVVISITLGAFLFAQDDKEKAITKPIMDDLMLFLFIILNLDINM